MARQTARQTAANAGRRDADIFMQETPEGEWADAIKPGVLGADEGLINSLGYVEAAKYLGINKPYRDGKLTDAASTAFEDYARAWNKRVSEALRSEKALTHATKSKSPAQLQREIDEVLAPRREQSRHTTMGTQRSSHAVKKQKRKEPRLVHVEAKTPAGYRWLKINARGASVTPEGSFAVTDEHEWAQSLNAAGAIEIK